MLSRAPTGRVDPPAKTRVKPKSLEEKSSSFKISTRKEPKKVVDPFAPKTNFKTSFGAMYGRGGLPCRLVHGSVKHKIEWIRGKESLDYSALLPIFADGLRETQHPLHILSHQGLLELLRAATSSPEKIVEGLSGLSGPLRLSLCQKTSFVRALDIFCLLNEIVPPNYLISHIAFWIPPIAAHVWDPDTAVREQVQRALGICHSYCGDPALKIIQARIPTFQPFVSTKPNDQAF